MTGDDDLEALAVLADQRAGNLARREAAATPSGTPAPKPATGTRHHLTVVNDGSDAARDALEVMRARSVRGLGLNNLPRATWLVDQLIASPSLTMMYGPPKSGKSFLAIDLAACVATGRPWLGKDTRQGNVLYVVAEGAAGATSRQEAWSMYHGDTDDLDRIVWLPQAINLYAATAIGRSAEASALAAYAREVSADLVIIDTLARCTLGAEENSAKDMGIVVAALDHIKDVAKCSVMFVHHSGKAAAAGARGSTALLGAVDAAFKVGGAERSVTIELENAKDTASGFAAQFAMHPVGDSIVLVPGSVPRISDGKVSATLETLRSIATDNGIATSTWQQACEPEGVTRSTFYRTLKRLVDERSVRNVGTDKQPRYVPT